MNEDLLQQLKGLGHTLLHAPDASDVFETQPRLTCTYQSRNERFILKETGVDRQFAQTYFCRYTQLKVSLEQAAKKKWPTTNQSRVVGINNAASGEVYVCGILFKHMKLKPQALDKYLSKKVVEKELHGNKNRVSDDDFLFLEDDGARIELTGENLPVHQLVSGICLAVKGRKVEQGKFEVSDICYPGMAPQKHLSVKSKRKKKSIMLLSGLNFAQSGVASLVGLDLLAQYINGVTGNSADIPTNIVRIVICGGLVGKNEELATSDPNSKSQIRALQPLQYADQYLQELARGIPVDIMPGQYDPATFFMPQQCLHKCLFPKAGGHQNLNRVTNPYDFGIGKVRILGTSGQNLNDVILHSDHDNRLHVMESFLMCRHIAPTCPDTLTCFPFNMIDPFVLEETPHILFAGNQSSFRTKLIQENGVSTRIICVPDFSVTSEAVIVSLHDLEAEAISFKTCFNDA
eukprot:g6830.t1